MSINHFLRVFLCLVPSCMTRTKNLIMVKLYHGNLMVLPTPPPLTPTTPQFSFNKQPGLEHCLRSMWQPEVTPGPWPPLL